MDNVACSGTEKNIWDCPHVALDDCGGGEGAGVVCTNEGKFSISHRSIYYHGVSCNMFAFTRVL